MFQHRGLKQPCCTPQAPMALSFCSHKSMDRSPGPVAISKCLLDWSNIVAVRGKAARESNDVAGPTLAAECIAAFHICLHQLPMIFWLVGPCDFVASLKLFPTDL